MGIMICMFKTGVNLELLTDIDMLLMVEERIEDGICHAIHRHAKANNKFKHVITGIQVDNKKNYLLVILFVKQ